MSNSLPQWEKFFSMFWVGYHWNSVFHSAARLCIYVCLKYRLESSNVPLEKNKAVACKDFCDFFFRKKVTLCLHITWYLYVACTNQSAGIQSSRQRFNSLMPTRWRVKSVKKNSFYLPKGHRDFKANKARWISPMTKKALGANELLCDNHNYNYQAEQYVFLTFKNDLFMIENVWFTTRFNLL